MEQKEYQIDYPTGEEPLLILPLCVGAAVLHGTNSPAPVDAGRIIIGMI